jgi:Cu/Zn superoxide dismutase
VTLYNGSEAVGDIDFVQLYENGPVKLNGTISKLNPGEHGLNVHELGDVRHGCKAAGDHFNPGQVRCATWYSHSTRK